MQDSMPAITCDAKAAPPQKREDKLVNGGGPEEWGDEAGFDEDVEGEVQSDDPENPAPGGNAPYATLHVAGPQTTPGSAGHPEECMPCTFYCFTRRGCNRGGECRFCHLAHQSKLQMRREAWKKQQREKRKSLRERLASDTGARRPDNDRKHSQQLAPVTPGGGGGCGGSPNMALPSPPQVNNQSGKFGCNGLFDEDMGKQSTALREKYVPPSMRKPVQQALQQAPSQGHALFSYQPNESILTIGQQTAFQPQVSVPVRTFRVVGSLPTGMYLNKGTGAISGAPQAAQERETFVVEADMADGKCLRASITIEVVDFTRGGFVIGHIGEFEPGKYMLLMYVPDDHDSGGSRASNSTRAGSSRGGRPSASSSARGSGRDVGRPQDMLQVRGGNGVSHGVPPSWQREQQPMFQLGNGSCGSGWQYEN